MVEMLQHAASETITLSELSPVLGAIGGPASPGDLGST
jgi:hypothetical protein